ncbi:MAG: GNAT family N-acetyltransferase [Acidobacteriota bacterium]
MSDANPTDSSLVLRAAREDDDQTLAAFNAALAQETEDKTLPAERLLAGVRALLADPSRGFYVVAERDGEAVGQIMVTTEWSDWRNGFFWWIQSVYVAPEARRQGVYSALHREVERRARDESACGIRLYVERENTGAQATYRRLGMSPTVYELYEVEL